jgi:hypothetical protein
MKWVGFGLIAILLLGGTMFTDVAESLNSYDAIKNLKDEGWVVGVGNNEYKPFDTVTRAEMAVFIVKADKGAYHKPATPAIQQYPDVPLDYWAASWISEAGQDIFPDGNFYPRNPATRADVAILVDLLLK